MTRHRHPTNLHLAGGEAVPSLTQGPTGRSVYKLRDSIGDMDKEFRVMRKLLAIAVLSLFLPGCAVAGVAMVGVAADNIAQGDDSYTNQGLDHACERTVNRARLDDGSCPSS